jgi:hypothetical protein
MEQTATSALKMEANCSIETLAYCQYGIRRKNPSDRLLYSGLFIVNNIYTNFKLFSMVLSVTKRVNTSPKLLTA